MDDYQEELLERDVLSQDMPDELAAPPPEAPARPHDLLLARAINLHRALRALDRL